MTTPSYDFKTLAVPTVGPIGTSVTLEQILTAAFGPNLGGYTDYYVAYQGPFFFSGQDFSYWDPTNRAVSKWLLNGTDITANVKPYWMWEANGGECLQIALTDDSGAANPHLAHVAAADVDQITLQIGNNIGPSAFILVPVGYDSNGDATAYTQYSVSSGFAASLVSGTAAAGAPTAADVVATAQRFAAEYPDVPNDNDCDYIAVAVAAATGATLTDRSSSLDPALNESAGFWRIVYRGSDPNPVQHWSALVEPGDIVRMGWSEGGQHTTTIISKSASQNADGTYDLTVYDNVAVDARGTEIIGIHPAVSGGARYDTATDPTKTTIFRISPDSLYLIQGSDEGQVLSANIYDCQIVGGAGDDTVIAGPGADQIDGGGGVNAVDYHGDRAEYSIVTYQGSDGLLHTSIIDQGSASDGSDDLVRVNRLSFTDRGFELAGADLNHISNVAGSRYDDVLFQNDSTGQVYYAAMVDGVFQGWGAQTGELGTDWQVVASGNVNPSATNRSAEVFAQQQSTGTIYYASLDTGATTWGVVSSALTADWRLRAVADVDGDASVDAIIQDTTDGTIHYANMDDGTFQGWNAVTTGLTPDWVAVGAGDVNGDGFADIVVQQQSTGVTHYADMANGVFSSWNPVTTALTPEWKAAAVADVNGDGFADVIFQTLVGGNGAAAGATSYANMANGAFSDWGVVAAGTSADWGVQGVADVDNDGFADVLFQNSVGSGGVSPGTTYYANMGPTSSEGWGIVNSAITAEWHVI